jgi:hypothetical protein
MEMVQTFFGRIITNNVVWMPYRRSNKNRRTTPRRPPEYYFLGAPSDNG